MSQASEWAKHAAHRPTFKMQTYGSEQWHTVAQVNDAGGLDILCPTLSHDFRHHVLAFARWILDTFGEHDRREQAIVDATMPRPAQVLYGVVAKRDSTDGWMLGMDFFETPIEVAALLLRGFIFGKPLAEVETRIVRLEVEP